MMNSLEFFEVSKEKKSLNVLQVFTKYKPALKSTESFPGSHPANLVESAALSASAKTNITYKIHPKLVACAKLSDAQVEAVSLCCESHEEIKNGLRGGFLLGDGTGVGKTRTLLGIIYENVLCGRPAAVWITVNKTLVQAITTEIENIHLPIKPSSLLASSKSSNGIIRFCTYKKLGNEYEQLLRWEPLLEKDFDGVIVFDESHKLKNPRCQAAKRAVAIQEEYPNARVVYASATGISDTESLHYMTRLQLWGMHSPFSTFDEFRNQVGERNLDLMELLAMELRSTGKYIARTISFEECDFAVDIVHLSRKQHKVYDYCCEIWQCLRKKGMELKNAPKTFWCNFYQYQQRFFHALLCCCKARTLPKYIRSCIEANVSVVIGIQTTGGSAAKCFKKQYKYLCQKEELSVCAEILKTFIKENFRFDTELIRMTAATKLPVNVMDFLASELHKSDIQVAQLTGRKFQIRSDETITSHTSKDDLASFQNGEKRVVIISDASSVGISLHASRDHIVTNKDPRVHILLEFPWSAEKVIQQMGRTNRTNQLYAPSYLIRTTNVPGELRFSASLTMRVKAMGASVYGDRNLSDHLHLNTFDLFNQYGESALETCLQKLNQTITDRKSLESVGIDCGKRYSLETFFNRLLGLPIKCQLHIFGKFKSTFDSAIGYAKVENSYNEGLQVIDYGRVTIRKKQDFQMKHGVVSLVTFERKTGKTARDLEKLMLKTKHMTNGFYLRKGEGTGWERKAVICVVGSKLHRPNGNVTKLSSPLGQTWVKLPNMVAHRYWEKHRKILSANCYHVYRGKECIVKNCKMGLGRSTHKVFVGSIFSLILHVLGETVPNMTIAKCHNIDGVFGGIELPRLKCRELLWKLNVAAL